MDYQSNTRHNYQFLARQCYRSAQIGDNAQVAEATLSGVMHDCVKTSEPVNRPFCIDLAKTL